MFATLVIGLLSILFAFFFFYTRFEHVICDNNVCMVGKTALVTGGSKGLGYEIVLQLAARGCRIIIASRTGSENLRKRIIEETNNPNIVLEYVDFLSFRSVRELAKRLNKSEKKIDILVNNAGVGASHSEPTEDGLNRTMQINHYSGFLLTHLIADLLKNSENGRIIFTSSFLAAFHLMRKSSATPTKIHDSPLNTINYANSKLCAIIMAEMFARKLNKWNITSNCYQPGIARTEIFSESQKNLKGSIDKVIYYSTMHVLEVIFGVSPKLTSQTAVHIATAKEYKHLTGQYVGRYFNNVKPKLAYDKEFCENLWKASEVTVKLKPEEKIEYNT